MSLLITIEDVTPIPHVKMRHRLTRLFCVVSLVLFGRIAVEFLSDLEWNLYPVCRGILIRFPVESLSGLVGNIHNVSLSTFFLTGEI